MLYASHPSSTCCRPRAKAGHPIRRVSNIRARISNADNARASVSVRRSNTAVSFTGEPGAESAPARLPSAPERDPMSPYIAVTNTAPARAHAAYAIGRLKRWRPRDFCGGCGASSGSVSGKSTARTSRPVTLAGGGDGNRLAGSNACAPTDRTPMLGLDSDMASTVAKGPQVPYPASRRSATGTLPLQ